MRTLTATLLAAQKSPNRVPYLRLTFSKTGEDDVIIEQDRILGASGIESNDSQRASFVFQNSTGYFTSLDLKGWTVVIERGLKNAAGTVEYDSMPAMKVVSMDLDSRPGVLRANMSFIGIPDRLNLDKASKNYFNHWSNSKTVKSLITEIADGDAVDTELTEEQTTHEDNNSTILYGAAHGVAGVALTIPNRTITKLSFKLSKLGLPGGNVTFKISQDAGGSTLESKTLATSGISSESWGWHEVTFDTPQLVDERAWLTCEYSGGDISNCIVFAYNAVAVKPDEAFVLQNASDPDQSGTPDDTWEYPENGCVYRYKYTGGTGETNGVDCFQHCHDAGNAYEVVYDSEDSLIDSYAPADGFKIYEGQPRLEVIIKTLLGFTGCVGIFKADGKLHVSVPTTSGNVYEYQYTLVGIDGGSPAIDRLFAFAASYTYIDLANPINLTGRITDIEVWANGDIADLRVGTFYWVSGSTYTCRDSELIGAVTAGSKQRFSVTLNAVEGDFIGCYFTSGSIEGGVDGVDGLRYLAAECIDPDDSASFSLFDKRLISLYAIGTAHQFFSKSIRNALVIPNKVTVHSYSDGAVEYSGSATDATSYALLPTEDFRIMNLASGAQANSIAAAIIAQLQIASQQGSAHVPINLGAEIYDYVNVTDSREIDSRTGNLGYIRWSYIHGTEFSMFFSFGRVLISPITGRPSRPIYESKPVKETLESVVAIQEEQNSEVDKALGELKTAIGGLIANTSGGDVITKDSIDSQIMQQLGQQLANYLKNLVEDTSPQLGGDLDLNGKNLDFPTTPNISDCLDQDDMASNSATKLATQQSIKAYADTKLANVAEDTSPQLGGDLDLNGKNLDFPSTPNISDCKDEDNMASNSATMLATQQSIKAYADTKLANVVEDTSPQLGGMLDPNSKDIGDATHVLPNLWVTKAYIGSSAYRYIITSSGDIDFYVPNAAGNAAVLAMYLTDADSPILSMNSHGISNVLDPTSDQDAATKKYVDDLLGSVGQNIVTGARAIGTAYRNTSGKTMFVFVSWTGAGLYLPDVYCDADSPPVTVVGLGSASPPGTGGFAFFAVPDNYYYKIEDQGQTLYSWVEYT